MGGVAALRQAAGFDKAVDSAILNRFGVQVARTVAAQAAVQARRWPIGADPALAEAVGSVRRDGFAVVPDLLTDEEFARVEAAAARAIADGTVPSDVVDNGGVRVAVRWRNDVADEDRRDLDLFFGHPTVLALGAAAERVELQTGAGRCTLQDQQVLSTVPDLEAQIHSDTFQPTHKLWLYLTDVTSDDGPLAFYPGSHRLRWRTLAGAYRESVGANRGSRRIPEEELERSGLHRREFLCRRNTLVIANTHGYHGRVQGSPPGHRRTLHIELRLDPFRRPKTAAVDTSRAVSATSAEPGE